MTSSEAQGVVIASLLAAGALGAVHDLSLGQAPSLRQGLGITVAGVLLALLSGPAPTVAAGFAVLLLISALYAIGDATLHSIGKALS